MQRDSGAVESPLVTPLASYVGTPLNTLPILSHAVLLLKGKEFTLSAPPPTSIQVQLPDHVMQPREFADVILGTNWIPDRETQLFCVDFLTSLKSFRLSCSATAGREATLP